MKTKKERTPAEWKKIFQSYIKTKDEEKKHSKYSPSGMYRTIGCPASANHCEGLKSEDNVHSVRGTNTHTLLEFLLREGIAGLVALKLQEANTFKAHISYDDEMLECARMAFYFVREEFHKLHKSTGVKPTLLIEHKSRCDEIVNDDCGGTSDVVMYQLFGVLHIMDYKNGKKVVDPTDNEQMLTYALGVAHELGWDFSEVWLTVIQPNAPHKLGPTRTWKTTIKRLRQYQDQLILAIKKSKRKDAPFVVNSDWCFFCVGRHTCPAKQEEATKKIMNKFQRPSATITTTKGETKDGKEKTKGEARSKGPVKTKGEVKSKTKKRVTENRWED